MVNYNNGKIYKIEPLNGEEGDIYIGSTTKEYLSQRMDTHRREYKQFLNGKQNATTSFNLFNKYGVSNCNIILLELVNVNSKDELLIREAYFIKNLKCINKNIPLRTDKEYREDNKEKIKEYMTEYREKNKDKIKEYNKIYNEVNKDKIKDYYEGNKGNRIEYFKEYEKQNKDKRSEYFQKYREQNKDNIKEKAKEYRKLNKDKINERKRELRQLKKLN